MGRRKIPYRHEGFLRYAALRNIEYHVQAARENLAMAQRELRWMEHLLALRTQQEATGEWPEAAGDPDSEEYWHGLWVELGRRTRSRVDPGPLPVSYLWASRRGRPSPADSGAGRAQA